MNMKKLDYLTLKLTNKCNMNCYMCGQNYEEGNDYNKDLEFSLIKRRIDEADTLKTVYLFGGEPLLYPDFSQLLDYLKNRNMKILITTNGVLLKRYIEDIVSAQVRDLTISIDSLHKETYKKIRGNDNLEIVLNNIRELIRYRKLHDLKYPKLGVNFVILPENQNEMISFYEALVNEFPEIERINFEAPMMVCSKAGEEYKEIMKKNFGIIADSWKCFENRIHDFSQKDIENIIKQISELKNRPKVTFLAPTIPEEIKQVFEKRDSSIVGSCNIALHALTILPEGDVVTCTDFPDLVVGNIQDNSLHDILNNSKMNMFRSYLKENRRLPICNSCPRQYDKGDFLI